MRNVMVRAWEIARAAVKKFGGKVKAFFAEALRIAWAEYKTEVIVEKLTKVGFKRWTKNGMDRMYINANRLGLEVEYYKTGNVAHAEWEGEKISNCAARRIMNNKTYFDLADNTLHSTSEMLLEAARNLLDKAHVA